MVGRAESHHTNGFSDLKDRQMDQDPVRDSATFESCFGKLEAWQKRNEGLGYTKMKITATGRRHNAEEALLLFCDT